MGQFGIGIFTVAQFGFGQLAVGYCALAQVGLARHLWSTTINDPAAVVFFHRLWERITEII